MSTASNELKHSRQFAKLSEILYIEAYECMKKEIDYMFAELKFEGAGARRRFSFSEDVVIKRCRIESLIIKNRYYDYWTDLFRARRENREIKDFDIDPRLMIMLCQSRERVGKRNAERQAKLDSSEKLERNFNCKNPQKFWKTSVQKESDQKSPAAVEPMMNSSNNLVFRPKVEV
ncbi:hypothetical protein L3Y34_009825 [Caenorhabditis briggsae]|uniref:Uncharacterized protein n=2 Tax=Caenorhabditis briggsae TaxID=6238 RepID=A0AAE9D4Q2_CAEBR|nr:hypothetical protein L3Y34_009825 [Caenorhabditis briggsae]